MSEAFHISTRVEQARVAVTVLEVTGDLDFGTYEELLHEAEAALDEGAHHLLIDLTHVEYIASAGLRAMHAILSRFNSAATSDGFPPASGVKSPYVKLLNPSQDVVRTLGVTGFDMLLEIFEDRQLAVASF